MLPALHFQMYCGSVTISLLKTATRFPAMTAKIFVSTDCAATVWQMAFTSNIFPPIRKIKLNPLMNSWAQHLKFASAAECYYYNPMYSHKEYTHSSYPMFSAALKKFSSEHIHSYVDPFTCACLFVCALSEHRSGKMKMSRGKCVPQFLNQSVRYWGSDGVWANLLTQWHS